MTHTLRVTSDPAIVARGLTHGAIANNRILHLRLTNSDCPKPDLKTYGLLALQILAIIPPPPSVLRAITPRFPQVSSAIGKNNYNHRWIWSGMGEENAFRWRRHTRAVRLFRASRCGRRRPAEETTREKISSRCGAAWRCTAGEERCFIFLSIFISSSISRSTQHRNRRTYMVRYNSM